MASNLPTFLSHLVWYEFWPNAPVHWSPFQTHFTGMLKIMYHSFSNARYFYLGDFNVNLAVSLMQSQSMPWRLPVNNSVLIVHSTVYLTQMNSSYPLATSSTQRKMPNLHTKSLLKSHLTLGFIFLLQVMWVCTVYTTSITPHWHPGRGHNYANIHNTLIFLIVKSTAQTYIYNTSCHFLAHLSWMVKVFRMVLSVFWQKQLTPCGLTIHTFSKISSKNIQN